MVQRAALAALLVALLSPVVAGAHDGTEPDRRPVPGSALFPMVGPPTPATAVEDQPRCARTRDRAGAFRALIRSGPAGCRTAALVLRAARAGRVPAGWSCRAASVRAAGVSCASTRDPAAVLFAARPAFVPRCASVARSVRDPCYAPAAAVPVSSDFDVQFVPCQPTGWPARSSLSYARLLAVRFHVLYLRSVSCAQVRPLMRDVVGRLTLGHPGALPAGWRCERAPRRQRRIALVGCELPGGAFVYAVPDPRLD